MPDKRKHGAAPPPHDSRNVPPRELDPARSKSVESVEQEVDDIVDALAARERERARRRGDLPPAGDSDHRKP
ncbi:MAG: hypothetical protein K0Q68_559 [Moraxellaceae bacterium]|nr:hypothetical protein [Moraxellaceae bacterium]